MCIIITYTTRCIKNTILSTKIVVRNFHPVRQSLPPTSQTKVWEGLKALRKTMSAGSPTLQKKLEDNNTLTCPHLTGCINSYSMYM